MGRWDALALMGAFRKRLSESAAAFGGVFRNRNLLRLGLAYLGSEIGGWAAAVTVSVIAFQAGGAAGVGLVLLLQSVPAALAAPFTALLGDRFSRRRVMIGADLIRVVLYSAAALVAFTDAPVVLIYVIATVSPIVSTAFRPAQAAILPSLARSPVELTAANVVSSTIDSVTAFAGPAVGGILIATVDTGAAFALTAATLIWSALLLFGIRPGPVDEEPGTDAEREEGAPARRGFMREALAGFEAIGRHRDLRLVVGLYAGQLLVWGLLYVFMVVIALDLLGIGEGGLGGLMAAMGVGGLIGVLLTAGLVGGRLATGFALGVLFWGAPIALIAVWDTTVGVFVLLGVIGVANTLVDVSAITLIQRAAPDKVLARVFGVLESLFIAAMAAGAIIAPALISWLGLKGALVAAGCVLPALVLLTWGRLRRLDAPTVTDRQLELVRGVDFLGPLSPATLEHLAGALQPLQVPQERPSSARANRANGST